MIYSVGGSWVNVASQATQQPWRDRTGPFQRKNLDQIALPQVKCFCSNEVQFVLKLTGSEPRDTLRTLNADFINLFPSIIPVISTWALVLSSEAAVQASGVCRSMSQFNTTSLQLQLQNVSSRWSSVSRIFLTAIQDDSQSTNQNRGCSQQGSLVRISLQNRFTLR